MDLFSHSDQISQKIELNYIKRNNKMSKISMHIFMYALCLFCFICVYTLINTFIDKSLHFKKYLNSSVLEMISEINKTINIPMYNEQFKKKDILPM